MCGGRMGKVKIPSRAFLALLIFLAALAIYVKSQVTSRGDTLWSLYVAASILKVGNTDLDEYAHLMSPDDYRLERVGSHIYSRFPIGTPFIAVPFVAIVENLFPLFEQASFSAYLSQHAPDQAIFEVEKVIASIVVAANAVLIFAIALRFLSPPRAVILALIFAFATSAWSTASRGLWQHGLSMLALSIALYLIVLSSDEPWLAQFAAIPLAFAYVIRPTNSISVLVFSIYILLVARRYFVKYTLWLLLLILPFLLYNYAVYGAALPPYYLPERLGNNPSLLEALVGNLVSPSRGLLVFSPVLALSIVGMALRLKRADWRTVDAYLVVILILHWISISTFRHWYGGWSIGPRFFTDMLPFFAYFLIPVVDRLPSLTQRWDVKPFVFWPLLAASIFIHFRCATDLAPDAWNSVPNNIDDNRYRLWDWSDIQFLRGLCPERNTAKLAH